jgi:uncharacterized membrane protein YdjX (TVP38/TMEM64 family)
MKAFFGRIGAFFKKNRHTVLTFSAIILAVAAISVISYLILNALGIMYFDEGGDLRFHSELFASFSSSFGGWVFFILLQTVLSMLLCIFPGVSMALIILSTEVVFPHSPLSSFFLCFISVAIASCTMYALGRFGGYPLCVRLVGKADCDRALDLLRDKGTFFFPFMMLFPFFPDEALTMVAGTTRMKLSWFLPSIFVARGIGIATIVFGLSIIPFASFTTVWHWVIFVAVVALLVVAVFLAARRFRRYMDKRSKRDGE